VPIYAVQTHVCTRRLSSESAVDRVVTTQICSGLVSESPPARRPTSIMPASVPVRTVPVAHAATASHSSVVKVLLPAGALTWEPRPHRRRFSRHPLRLPWDTLRVKRQFSGGRFEMFSCDCLGVAPVLPAQHDTTTIAKRSAS